MKRTALVGAVAAGVALLSVPLSALAQFPPSPPAALFYGSVADTATGQGVVAIVISGNKSTTCGASKVIDSGGPVYALDLFSDAHISGCAAPGRTVRFYIPPLKGNQPGRMAVETATVPSAFGAVQRNLTLGDSLSVKRIGVQVATDGIPGQ